MAVFTPLVGIRKPFTEEVLPTNGRVTTCYSVFDAFFPRIGLHDLTEGIYERRQTSYEEAQAKQHNYLLDQLCCGSRSRLLDVGCGYGTLLRRAIARGASAKGITISAEQARHCRQAQLDVRVLDYRQLGAEWHRSFDGVVANGSAEHFVQPADAAAGRDDAIYRAMFQTFHRLLDPDSPSQRVVTTTIHFLRRPQPSEIMRFPFLSRVGSFNYHFALLVRGFGGWYPGLGQLERCAAGYFDLIHEVDGTEDYRRTSEEWLDRVKRAMRSRTGARSLLDSFPSMVTHPIQYATMFWCMLVSESWNWQFRPPAPMRLLRQTWQCSRR
jgi:cyclopropane fatty-acyl-phospholipid synthase-like methyltransferase